MARLSFTRNLQRHIGLPAQDVQGSTVREVLDAGLAHDAKARGYVLDDQGGLRKHMLVFVDGQQIVDRVHLSDSLNEEADVHVMQALSGG